MDGDLPKDDRFPEPDPSAFLPEGCGSGRPPSSPPSSSLTVDNHKRGDFPSVLDQCTEWTEEKHNSYLTCLEASFVHELHRSMGLVARCAQKKPGDLNSFKQEGTNACASSRQFNVHRDGSWQKMNFQSSRSRQDTALDSNAILESQWIRHFTSTGKCPASKFTDLHEHNPGSSMASYQSSQSYMVAARSMKLSVCHSRHQSPAGCIMEVSDQNFSDEEDAEEMPRNTSARKRLKMPETDALRDDQVVPLSGETKDTSECPEPNNVFSH